MKNRTVRAGGDSPGVDGQNKQLARCPSPHLTLLPGSSGLIWVTENPKGTSGPIGSPIGYDKIIQGSLDISMTLLQPDEGTI